MYRKYIVEAIGTFFLVYTIGCSATIGVNVFFAAAAILAGMVYAGGPISGAHYNPAISLAVWIRGKLPQEQLLPYIFSQCVGALLAAGAMRITVWHTPLYGDLLHGRYATPFYFSPFPALLAEFLFTFALIFVVLHVATSRAVAGNSYYGIAIGFTLLSGILAIGSLSGAAFNPAVAISLPLMGLSIWKNIWVYILSTFLAGAAAGYTFRALNPEDV